MVYIRFNLLELLIFQMILLFKEQKANRRDETDEHAQQLIVKRREAKFDKSWS